MTIRIVNRDWLEYIVGCVDSQFQAIITDPPYDGWLGDSDFEKLNRVCSGHIIMFCDPLHRWAEPDEIAYWVKPTSTKNYSRHLGRFVEEILIFRKGDTFNSDLHWSNYTGVYTDLLLKKQEHPYEKPVSLMERLVSIYTNPGDLILDPFAGSGSTLQAAYNCGRNAIGCEIERAWCDLMKKRLDTTE